MSWREIVENTLERHRMLRFGRRLGVAVSGGADSVFLLRALSELGLAAAVVHVNHGLRGADSDSDETFVRSLAADFELPVYVAAIPVVEGNVEQEARRGRYRFFEECIADGRCEAVATGHSLDDQAETVVGRFLRGAGTAGLSGIQPVIESRIVRPLIGLRRDHIRGWLRDAGIEWHEDCSNGDTDFQRNRIRLEVMPQLAQLNPSLPHVLASMAEWARAEEEYWDLELDRLEPGHLIPDRDAVLVRTGPFLELPPAVQRRLLRRGVERVRGSLRSIDFQHAELIRSMMRAREGSGRVQLPGLDIYRSFDWLRLAPPGFDSRLERDFEMEATVPGLTLLPERLLAIETELVTEPDVYNKQMNALDWGVCAGPLTLRNWRPGDSYRRVGRASAEKIKTLFQEYRVPLWERRGWPVIVRGGSIVWTRRFGPSGDFAAGPDSERILLIRDAWESNRAISASTEVCARTEVFAVPVGESKRASGTSGSLGAEVM